uniref:Uncharacterized protein n=1 Tax=Glossina austeni TaxID=7395 RepID=A0A1A9V140_GLOAU
MFGATNLIELKKIFDTGLCREVGQLGVPSVDLVDLSSPYPALQSFPSCNRSAKNTVKQDLFKDKMVKCMQNPPRSSCATTVKNSMNITSTLPLSSNKAVLPVPHISLHSNQVIDLSSKANAEPQATNLSSTNLQGELAIGSASWNASPLNGKRELISVPPRKSNSGGGGWRGYRGGGGRDRV